MHDFVPLERYSDPSNHRFVFLLDWHAALHQAPGAVVDYHLMSALRKYGYFNDTILSRDEFLYSHPRFLVLDNSDCSWFDAAIRNDPHFEWRVVKVLDPKRQIIEVTQKLPLPPSAKDQ